MPISRNCEWSSKESQEVRNPNCDWRRVGLEKLWIREEHVIEGKYLESERVEIAEVITDFWIRPEAFSDCGNDWKSMMWNYLMNVYALFKIICSDSELNAKNGHKFLIWDVILNNI